MDRQQEMIERLLKENKELQRKLTKASKRYNYLKRKIRSLKKQEEAIGGRKRNNHDSKQTDKEIRNHKYSYRGSGNY